MSEHVVYNKTSEAPSIQDFRGLGKHYLARLADKTNVIYQVDIVSGITESNGSVRGRSIQLANGLRKLGIKPKDVIVISSRSHCDQTVVALGTLLIGAVVAPIHPELPYKDCVDCIKATKPKAIFCDVRNLGTIEKVVTETKVHTEIYLFDKAHATRVVFNKLLLQTKEDFKVTEVKDPKTTVAFIVSTQGTEDDPKLVCISHQSILYQALTTLDFIGMPTTIISYFPLSWILEVILMCSCFEHSVTRILPAEVLPRNTCKLIQDMHIEYAFLPTNYALKLVTDAAIKDYNLSALKCFYVGSVETSAQDMMILRQNLQKVKFSQFYASTEAGIVSVTPVTDYNVSLDHPASAGRVLPGVKIKIVDMQSDEPVGPDGKGEFMIYSEGVMLGYYQDAKKSMTVLQKHYLRSGDIGSFDSEGWLYVYGRKEDMVTINGAQQCPVELENLITSHPFVCEALIVDDDHHILACIVALPNTNLDAVKIMKFLEERTESELPSKIKFFPDFPKTPIGNIKKGLVRKQINKVEIVYCHSVASLS